jgi:hypothetical protein
MRQHGRPSLLSRYNHSPSLSGRARVKGQRLGGSDLRGSAVRQIKAYNDEHGDPATTSVQFDRRQSRCGIKGRGHHCGARWRDRDRRWQAKCRGDANSREATGMNNSSDEASWPPPIDTINEMAPEWIAEAAADPPLSDEWLKLCVDGQQCQRVWGRANE